VVVVTMQAYYELLERLAICTASRRATRGPRQPWAR
jgi:hypothetical protein